MKRMLFVAIAAVLFASCSKDYTCTCTSVKPDGTIMNVEKKNISGTKGGSEKKCKQFDNVNNDLTTTCLLD